MPGSAAQGILPSGNSRDLLVDDFATNQKCSQVWKEKLETGVGGIISWTGPAGGK